MTQHIIEYKVGKKTSSSVTDYCIYENSKDHKELQNWIDDNKAGQIIIKRMGFSAYIEAILFDSDEDLNLFLLMLDTEKYKIREYR